jgi:hypothetical protein
MMMNVIRWCVFLASLCIVGVAAAQLAGSDPDAYAHVAVIGDGSDALRKVELPRDLLANIARRDRRDLQVFDASGLWMPSKLVNLPAQTKTQTQFVEFALFPVERRVVGGASQYSFRVSADGEDVAVNFAVDEDQPERSRNYIVYADREANNTLGDLVGVQFEWSAGDQNEVLPVRIEGSADLENWKVLKRGAVISDLEHEGVTLTKKQVSFRAFAGDYLRVTWPGGVGAPALTSVSGMFSKDHRLAQPWRHATLECHGENGSQATGDACMFDIGGVPASSMRMVRADGDYYLQADMSSRSNPDAAWVMRGGIEQYHLSFDDGIVMRDWSVLPGWSDRSWKLTFKGSAASGDSREVEIRWRPLYVAFIAQGQAPYRLAVGSSVAGLQGSSAVNAVIKRSSKTWVDIETVATGAVAVNDVESYFWTRDRIETYLLWLVLIIGVAVMLWIALGVFKRLEHDDQI